MVEEPVVEETNVNPQPEEAAAPEAPAAPRRQEQRTERPQRRSTRRFTRRRRTKVCRFCEQGIDDIDYKDVGLLREFLSSSGRILPRRRTGNCAKHQRRVAKAIKRARYVALLPFTAAHMRGK